MVSPIWGPCSKRTKSVDLPGNILYCLINLKNNLNKYFLKNPLRRDCHIYKSLYINAFENMDYPNSLRSTDPAPLLPEPRIAQVGSKVYIGKQLVGCAPYGSSTTASTDCIGI